MMKFAVNGTQVHEHSFSDEDRQRGFFPALTMMRGYVRVNFGANDGTFEHFPAESEEHGQPLPVAAAF